jgi:hypothetical protein
MFVNSWVAVQLAASQEGFISMGLGLQKEGKQKMYVQNIGAILIWKAMSHEEKLKSDFLEILAYTELRLSLNNTI